MHKILEKAIEDDILRKHYDKELSLSFKTAMKYREKINPSSALPDAEIMHIKRKVKSKVIAELNL